MRDLFNKIRRLVLAATHAVPATLLPQLREALWVAWAAHVLDAWADESGGQWFMHEGACVLDSWLIDENGNAEEPRTFKGKDGSASRMLAADAVWDELEGETKAAIGVRP